jgi:hypothetical protein
LRLPVSLANPALEVVNYYLQAWSLSQPECLKDKWETTWYGWQNPNFKVGKLSFDFWPDLRLSRLQLSLFIKCYLRYHSSAVKPLPGWVGIYLDGWPKKIQTITLSISRRHPNACYNLRFIFQVFFSWITYFPEMRLKIFWVVPPVNSHWNAQKM